MLIFLPQKFPKSAPEFFLLLISPEIVLILCLNHHKEFDYGERKILEHNKEKVIFELNNNKYKISLEVKE